MNGSERSRSSFLTVAAIALMTWSGGSAPAAAQHPWEVVSHDVSFTIRNAGLPVRGSFENVEVTVDFDPSDPGSASLTGRLDPASIRTGIAMRDRHLAGRQFFDVRRFPRITMRSLSAQPAGTPGDYRGIFEVVIRDVTREVPIDFRFEETGGAATLSGTLTIDRVEFGVGDGGFVLGDDVTVEVRLELIRRNHERQE